MLSNAAAHESRRHIRRADRRQIWSRELLLHAVNKDDKKKDANLWVKSGTKKNYAHIQRYCNSFLHCRARYKQWRTMKEIERTRDAAGRAHRVANCFKACIALLELFFSHHAERQPKRRLEICLCEAFFFSSVAKKLIWARRTSWEPIFAGPPRSSPSRGRRVPFIPSSRLGRH